MKDLSQSDAARGKGPAPLARVSDVGIDIHRHLAQRKAVTALRRPPGVVLCSQRFKDGMMIARVLVDERYYDVDARLLKQLREGALPAELGLDPAPGED